MSTHNIRFYEDLTKIIFELSSNIIKYAPYFFCCYGVSCFTGNGPGKLLDPRKKMVERIVRFGDSPNVSTTAMYSSSLISSFYVNYCMIKVRDAEAGCSIICNLHQYF